MSEKVIVGYVAMNEGDFDIENMSFSKTLEGVTRSFGDTQKYKKVTIRFEDV